jgi:hypothetical protein
VELSIESSTAAGGEIIKPSGPHVKIPESLKLSNEAYTTYSQLSINALPLGPGIRVHLKRVCIYRIHINLYDINLKLR